MSCLYAIFDLEWLFRASWYLTWVNFESENKNVAIDLKSLEAAFQEEGDLQPHLVENLIKEAQPETHREFV